MTKVLQLLLLGADKTEEKTEKTRDGISMSFSTAACMHGEVKTLTMCTHTHSETTSIETENKERR